ncbi:hypothetical protein [Microbacterium sp. ProA8]|uniref:hypothetical protein n=1 Tax=Microbacterium chionoecetis TaxID=3153754 RepID=UPI0032652FA6
MIRLPDDKYDNVGWAVVARKFHRCEVRNDGCRGMLAGTPYYRAIAWPGSDANGGRAPWVMRICRDCLHDERRLQFDAALNPGLVFSPESIE